MWPALCSPWLPGRKWPLLALALELALVLAFSCPFAFTLDLLDLLSLLSLLSFGARSSVASNTGTRTVRNTTSMHDTSLSRSKLSREGFMR